MTYLSCYDMSPAWYSCFEVRNALSNLSIFIAIIAMTATSLIVGLKVPTLDVPTNFEVCLCAPVLP